MAHEMWELKQRQLLPLKAKIQMTITRVREWYERYCEGNLILACDVENNVILINEAGVKYVK